MGFKTQTGVYSSLDAKADVKIDHEGAWRSHWGAEAESFRLRAEGGMKKSSIRKIENALKRKEAESLDSLIV